MCLMAPAQVVSVDGNACYISSGGRLERVSTLFADAHDLASGDWVLVVGGNVMKRLDATQAAAMSAALGVATNDSSRRAERS